MSSVSKPDGYRESLLPLVLLRHMRTRDGDQATFAERWSIPAMTTTRWATGVSQPGETYMDRFAEEMGVSSSGLRALGTLGTSDLVELIEVLSSMTPEEKEKAARAEAVNARFMEMVQERGEQLPPAAYVIYLTADTEGRESLLSVLDNHADRIHIDTPTDTLQLIIDLSSGQGPTDIP